MKKGDTVICIDDTLNPNVDMDSFPNWVEHGKKYTIRKVEKLKNGKSRILLNEIVNPVVLVEFFNEEMEPGFSLERFSKNNEEVSSELFHIYTYITVESFTPENLGPRHGEIHVRPINNQSPFDTHLYVSCSKELSYSYPVGTRFRIKAKLNRKKNGAIYIYSPYSWNYEVLE